jgi:hypothetical protein
VYKGRLKGRLESGRFEIFLQVFVRRVKKLFQPGLKKIELRYVLTDQGQVKGWVIINQKTAVPVQDQTPCG